MFCSTTAVSSHGMNSMRDLSDEACSDPLLRLSSQGCSMHKSLLESFSSKKRMQICSEKWGFMSLLSKGSQHCRIHYRSWGYLEDLGICGIEFKAFLQDLPTPFNVVLFFLQYCPFFHLQDLQHQCHTANEGQHGEEIEAGFLPSGTQYSYAIYLVPKLKW